MQFIAKTMHFTGKKQLFMAEELITPSYKVLRPSADCLIFTHSVDFNGTAHIQLF